MATRRSEQSDIHVLDKRDDVTGDLDPFIAERFEKIEQ